ncbi:general secretion pathway protein H [Hyphomonas neptunium ATCC 15444]|uniref:Type II secretion system protein H n=2 Tax=Hyphomonas TaxID=85 RepID=Q0C123_HYPNA|nr:MULTISPECIES: GspH/FimT family pseudopilin [Hyphomonas]ABI75938.1 general secretion pathway protein H [Hyphomonas neptunium ATCC 15444]KCZ95015.1 general secretion pathway protein H [Hyphomonas hirschiana VP5]
MIDIFSPAKHSDAQAPLRDPEAGLSLVEIMVTLSIIGVATTLILLTIPARPLHKQEADRLQEALEQTAGRSLVTGQPMGLIIEGQSYTPAIWQNGNWRPLQSYQLPSGIRFEIDGKAPMAPEEGETALPAVIFDPLGHTAPVSIELVRNNSRTSLTLLADGRVSTEVR